MKFFKQRFSGKLKNIRNNLTHINSRESLGVFSFIIIIFLDIFILTAIFQGLDEHTRQLSSPEEEIPEICRDIIIENDWSPSNYLDQVSSVLTQRHYYNSYGLEVHSTDKSLHPSCSALISELELLQKDHNVKVLFETRTNLMEESKKADSDLEDIRASYDTVLLRKIARDEPQNSLSRADVERIRHDFEDKTLHAASLKERIKVVDIKIKKNKPVNSFIETARNASGTFREKLKKEYHSLVFWYPVKKLLMEFLFLLPLFLTFYFWNSRSLKKEKGLQILISSHLLVVSSIPVFLKIGEAIYDIIPKKLLKDIWNFLVSLKLIALWHYIIIFFGILLGIFLIYLVQKKIFSRQRIIEKRMSKGQCVSCSMKLPHDAKFCPFCGFHQYTKCPKCKKETFVYGKFCSQCGKDLSVLNNNPA